MAVVSVAATLLVPKPKNQDSGRSPDVPTIESGVPLPCVWGASKIAGALFYSTPPKKTTVSQSVGKGSSRKQESESYVCELVGYAFTAINSVKLTKLELNGEVVYEPLSTNGDIIAKTQDWQNRIVWKTGSATQTPEATLVAKEGSLTPAFKGMSYLLIEDLNLSDYGNQYPTVKAVVESEAAYPNLRVFFDDLINKAGVNTLANSNFNLNILSTDASLTSIPFFGASLMLDGKDFQGLMQPLMEFWQLYLRAGNGGESIISLPPYLQTTLGSVTTIRVTDILGSGDSMYTYNDQSLTDIPNELSLTYIDINVDYEPENALAKVSRGQVNATDFQFNYVYDRSTATTGAQRLLRNYWLRKGVLKIKLPLRFISLVEQGQIVTFTDDTFLLGKNWIVVNVTIGDLGFIEVSLNRYSPIAYAYVSEISNSTTPETPTGGANQTELTALIIDSTTIETETSRIQPYLAVASPGFNGTYYVFESLDNVNFNLVHTGTQRTTTGTLVNNFTVDAHHYYPSFDEVLTVQLSDASDTLASVSDSEFWLGENLISIDKMLVSYKTATLVSPGVYELSGLLFGAFDSEPLIGLTYPAGTHIAQISKPGFQTDRPSTVSTNVTGLRYYKIAGSPTTNLLNLPSFPVMYERNIGKALAPIVLHPEKVGTDYLLSWIPRTNNRTEYFMEDGVPINTSNPDGETYRVRIYDNNSALIHTATVTGSRQYTYPSSSALYTYTVEQNSQQANIGWGFIGRTISY